MVTQNEGNWTTIGSGTLLFTVIAGLFLAEGALESRRPQQQGAVVHSDVQEVVMARLWEDPLGAIQRHWAGVLEHVNAKQGLPPTTRIPHTISGDYWMRRPEQNESRSSNSEKLLRLFVMVPGTPYAEHVERRRRQRHAVVMALTNEGYEPVHPEQIGYVVAPSFVHEASHHTTNVANCGNLYDGINSPVGPDCAILIGTESFQKSGAELEVVWLNAKDFSPYPLHQVAALAAVIETKQHGDNHGETISVLLGPMTSGELRGMKLKKQDGPLWQKINAFHNRLRAYPKSVRELLLPKEWRAEFVHHERPSSEKHYRMQVEDAVRGMHVVSYMSTVPLDQLFEGEDWARGLRIGDVKDAEEVDRIFGNLLGVKSFRSVVARDDLVLTGVLRELEWRGACQSAGEEIAVVTEQDTIYGRVFADVMKEARDERGYDDDVCGVVKFGYLRSVDGELPPDPSQTERSTSKPMEPAGTKQQRPWSVARSVGDYERSHGDAQLDYARRLADRIAFESQGDQGNRVVAIGVLGSDVYDKELVLRALKDRLPTATFFTTDLDARMTDPSVNAWMRNTIVGSAYGFTLQNQRSGGFRSSYQTALYRAVALAMRLTNGDERSHEGSQSRNEGTGGAEYLPNPLLFEVSRTGAVLLKQHVDQHTDTTDAKKPQEFTGNEATRLVQDGHGGANPVAMAGLAVSAGAGNQGNHSYIRSSRDPVRMFLSWALVAGPLLALTLFALRMVIALSPTDERRRFRAHLCVFGLSLLSLFSVILLSLNLSEVRHEPWPFLEGVSGVPTIILQFTATVFAISVVVIARGREKEWDLKAQKELRLDSKAPKPPKSLSDWMYVSRELWRDGQSEAGTKRIDQIWRLHVNRTVWHARLPRVMLGVAVGLLAAWLVLYEGQPLLSRGLHTVATLTHVSMILSVAAMAAFWSGVLSAGGRLVRDLADNDVTDLHGREKKHEGLDPLVRRRWRAMELVVERTEAVGPVIVLPFVVLILMVVARMPVFEGWVWTPGLVSYHVLFAAYILHCALRFQFSAQEARRRILEDLYNRKHVEEMRSKKAQHRLDLVIESIRANRHGAFVPWSRHPLFQSIALPASGFALLLLVERFM